jgi:prepilin-type N-terminal cleavage/methylation domain-containing protein
LRGFTLVETIVVTALFLIVMLALGDLYFNFNTLYGYQNAIVSTASGAGRVINETENIVLPADQVLSFHVFSTGTYSSGLSTLVVEMPSTDASGAAITGSYDYAVIYVSGANVYRLLEINAASHRTAGTVQLANSLSSLTFTYDHADFTQVTKVTADISTAASVKANTATDHEIEAVYLRNSTL